jgi:hypothetical protein
MAELITDHSFRPAHSGGRDSCARSVSYGTCVWLGTCGRPAEEHARIAHAGGDWRVKR